MNRQIQDRDSEPSREAARHLAVLARQHISGDPLRSNQNECHNCKEIFGFMNQRKYIFYILFLLFFLIYLGYVHFVHSVIVMIVCNRLMIQRIKLKRIVVIIAMFLLI